MNRKITALCSMILALSVCVTVFGATDISKTDVTTATANVFYANKVDVVDEKVSGRGIIDDVVEGFTGSSSDLGDYLGAITDVSLGDSLDGLGSGSSGGIGDALGGVGDAIGSIGGLFRSMSGIRNRIMSESGAV